MVFVASDTSPVYDIAASITPPDAHREKTTDSQVIDIALLAVGVKFSDHPGSLYHKVDLLPLLLSNTECVQNKLQYSHMSSQPPPRDCVLDRGYNPYGILDLLQTAVGTDTR